jgi:hypothetical protein
MFGIVTALEGLHVTANYRDINMQHTRSRHAAWDPQTPRQLLDEVDSDGEAGVEGDVRSLREVLHVRLHLVQGFTGVAKRRSTGVPRS